MFRHIKDILSARLYQKFIGAVGLAVVFIGVLVLTPDIYREFDDQKLRIKEQAEQLMKSMNSAVDAGQSIRLGELSLGSHQVVGFEVCQGINCDLRAGETITRAEPTELSVIGLFDSRFKRAEFARRITWNATTPRIISLRIDTTVLYQNIYTYIKFEIWYVFIITLFALIVATYCINKMIVLPALQLKQNITRANNDPGNSIKYLLNVNSKSELSGLIHEFNKMLLDIDDYQTKLSKAKESSDVRWKYAIEGSGDGIWDWNPVTDDIFFSPQILNKLGYGSDHVIATMEQWIAMIHPEDREKSNLTLDAHLNALSSEFSVNNRIRRADGSWLWVLSRGMVVTRDEDQLATRVVGTHTDISIQKDNEDLIWSQANIDTLTNLPNRRMYKNYLRRLANGSFGSIEFTLFYIDLDQFKSINDTLGHKVGDELLVSAASRLSEAVGEEHVVSRIGGDEFTVILRDITDKNSINDIANAILKRISESFYLSGNVFNISASIGITRFPEDAADVVAIEINADQALYESKDNGRNQYSYFNQAMRDASLNRLSIAKDLKAALDDEQFEVYYQPIVDMKTGCIVKAEALVRWNHPEKGLILPSDFIQIAEESGLIVGIGDWVFYQAIVQLAYWRKHYKPEMGISINTSAAQYRDNGSDVNHWLEHITAHGVSCNAVVVEITESLIMGQTLAVTSRFNALRQAGIKIALDDFGTGYTSLSYLQKIQSDYLKIDYSFVKDIAKNKRSIDLCKTIIDIAHNYDMKVIAEGIEQLEQRDLLKSAKADLGQGYLFCKPMPAQDFERMLVSERSKKTTAE